MEPKQPYQAQTERQFVIRENLLRSVLDYITAAPTPRNGSVGESTYLQAALMALPLVEPPAPPAAPKEEEVEF